MHAGLSKPELRLEFLIKNLMDEKDAISIYQKNFLYIMTYKNFYLTIFFIKLF
jgi:hypothetical protein